MRRAAVLATVLTLPFLAGACAARPGAAVLPSPAPVDVDALVRQGCYSCLDAAFAAASTSGDRHRAFEAALLLAARSKELGLPPDGWLEDAYARLPPGPDWAAYLDIVVSQPVDPLSGDRDVLMTEALAQRRPLDVYDTWREQLTAGPGSALLRAYLDLSIACRPRQDEQSEEAVAAALGQFGDVPLIQYRAGLCGGSEAMRLAAVRDADPDFVDAELELGRRALQQRLPDVEEALRRFQSARAAFPASPVIPASIGALRETREEWAEALAEYDATLTLAATHRDAVLGRTIALSYLSRHEEAMVSATRLIELGSWFIGQAHYWRGWNEFRLGRMADARSDVDLAKKLMVNAPTFVLSGLIEWSQKRLESAETELQAALNMDFGQCEAASYLGGVRAERYQWPESRAAFAHAEQCFGLSIVTRREAIAGLSATPAAAAANAVPIAGHERAIAEAETRRAEAARSIATIDRHLAAPAGR